MSTEEGYVISVNLTRAVVRTQRSGMCESCKSRASCSSLGGNSDMETEAINKIQAGPGDRVLLEIPTGSLWKIVVILYMIPVLFLMAGSLIGFKLGGSGFFTPELLSLLLGIGSCTLSYLLIKLIAGKLNQNTDFIPRIIKIL